MATATEYRLSTAIRPVHYDIIFTPDLEQFTFAGEESIDLELDAAVDSITLNAAELEIGEVQAVLADGAIVKVKESSHDDDLETVTFVFGGELQAGTATLQLRFTGTLNDQLRGFYRSRYTGEDGKDHYLASTQFEATDARRAFPCWDDPAVKATFQITLVAPSDLSAISNMPIESETPLDDGTRVVQFKPSPRMSTYLVALIVGDMACVEAVADNGTLLRVWTIRGREDQGRFALENAVRLLAYYNDYFGIPFPLEKLDHIAIPDFAAGAMENWGAITYRETALLFDPVNSSAAARQRILEVVSHEMAHMWFGDLVTMEWWDDLWLNESFASWMGDKAVDALYPEWSMWTQFVSHDTNSALGLDGLRNSHPIEARVNNPAEIRELFDAISYSKGGSTLRMLEEFLTPAVFQRGLRDYLNAHRYANARTEDLWAALEAASGKPVTEVMNSWVKQTGYPLLEADVSREGKLGVSLIQRRFLYDHLLDHGEDDRALWQVPVTVMIQGQTEKVSGLMRDRNHRLNFGGTTPALTSWVKVNGGQTGFFRVNYSEREWERLRDAIANRELSATDRVGLQNDAYALVRAGMAPATTFLELVEAFENEDDATVWGDVAANLGGLGALLAGESFLEQFDSFARDLFHGVAGRVGWDPEPGEGHLDSIRRSIALGQAGSYRDTEVLAEAKTRFARYLNDSTSVHPDLRGVVLALAGQEGDRATFEALWSFERKAELQEEKMRFFGALARVQDRALLQENLRRSMDPEEVRIQDTVILVGAVAGNRQGRDLAWEFVKDNWDELDRRYGKGGFAVTRLVGITGGFTTLARAQEVDEFFQAHPAPSAARTIQQSLERIRLNNAWLARNRDDLAHWFAHR
jgi:puromycin-sensitive aminopeptidase